MRQHVEHSEAPVAIHAAGAYSAAQWRPHA